jgi:YebC/PmpR family DNA-binding regulatory protein
MGGGDINANPRLRTAVTTARQQSMPKDNIDRAIKKGTGELEGITLEELSYEGYGPGGVAIILDALTDNRNRLVSELRFMFSRHGGNLGENGSVGWMFKKHGVITIDKKATDEDRLLEIALEAGADDVSSDSDSFQVTTPPDKLHAVRDAIEKAAVAVGAAEISRIPENTVTISGHTAEQVLKLLEVLEDHDDVQSVLANFDISDQELAQISAASEKPPLPRLSLRSRTLGEAEIEHALQVRFRVRAGGRPRPTVVEVARCFWGGGRWDAGAGNRPR